MMPPTSTSAAASVHCPIGRAPALAKVVLVRRQRPATQVEPQRFLLEGQHLCGGERFGVGQCEVRRGDRPGFGAIVIAKPDPAIYLEGVRLLGSSADTTLYVGDNRLLDADGSTAAGLLGVWLNRGGEPDPVFEGHEIGSLLELLGWLAPPEKGAPRTCAARDGTGPRHGCVPARPRAA